VDGGPINVIEGTGAAMLEALAGDLCACGIRPGFANFRTEVQGLLNTGVKAAPVREGSLLGQAASPPRWPSPVRCSGRAEVVKAFKHGKSDPSLRLGEYLAAAETAGQ
jgi:hypothetical protein